MGELGRHGSHLGSRRLIAAQGRERGAELLGPLPIAAELTGERAERPAHLVVGRVGGEHAQARRPRRRRVPEIDVVDAHQRAIEVEPLGCRRVCASADHLERDRLRGQVLRGLEERQHLARRRDALRRLDLRADAIRRQVARDRRHRLRPHPPRDAPDRERLAEVAERVARPLEALLFERCESHQQLELRRAIGGLLELLREHVDQRLPVAARLLDPGERAQGAQLTREHLQRFLIRDRRTIEIDELLFLQRRDLDQQRRPLVDILLARGAPPVRRDSSGQSASWIESSSRCCSASRSSGASSSTWR